MLDDKKSIGICCFGLCRLPKNRDIVVVRNENGEATLKRYINIKGRVFLKPDNPDYGEPTSEVGILVGVVIGAYDILWVLLSSR